ncbi:pentatricopeptide repeat-containing protein At1g80880, mitochondrial [Diospyros lotus]|uniref:pentatricopeptide repeat-containing protein At1g80880, mitochondrial n=1 Tax=Diospyros lotus TaxID=55363 RepID=UPI00224EC7AC|nr:pentatricopeptide repeat-containing protein At1g80880, mitochondrial [Diospyros lotus]
MAFFAIARRFHKPHPKQFFPFLPHSVTQPPPPCPCHPRLVRHFLGTFHRAGLLLSRPRPQTPRRFSSFQPSYGQSLRETIDFSACVNENHQSHQNPILRVDDLLAAVRKADQFSSVGEAIEFLDEAGLQANEDLVFLAVWALRDEWKLAFLVFKWGQKWDRLGENNCSLMIWVLGNHKKFNTAWCLIRDMHRSSLDTGRAMLIMMDRYATANDPGKAIQTFQIMEKFKMIPDLKAFHMLLSTLCEYGNIEEAEEFMLLNKKLFPLETKSFNIILNGWCNISVDVCEAKRIWREMAKCCITPDATSYTHMISCFSKVRNLFDSLRLYDEMKKRGWAPGVEVYNSLIYVLTHENCLKEALKILDKMKEAGVQPNSATYNSMICPLCEVAKLEEARTVFADMIAENIRPTIDTYHAFLEGANVDGALEVLVRMKKAGLGPTRDTFLLILGKFFKLKQPEDALKVWVEMKQFEMVPDSAHYNLLVEGLANCGLLIKAREYYAEMRLNGIIDDPKLKKFLQEPVQHSSLQSKKDPFGAMRNVKRGRWRSSAMRRNRGGKHPYRPRKTKSVKLKT